MTIAYLGNFKFHWCTEVHIAKTLEMFGHEVLRIQEDETRDLDYIVKVANRRDMFLWTRTPSFLKVNGQEMMKRITTLKVSYHLDLYFGISREGNIDEDPWWKSDYVFQVDGYPESMKKFKEKGINAYWVMPAVYKPECYIAEARDDLRNDIVFVGSYLGYHSEWDYREKLISHLLSKYPNFRLFPNKEHPVIMGNDLNQLMASAKIVVADTLCMGFKHQNYWSNRVHEETGRGGFVIHPRVPGLDKVYQDKKHLAFYDYGNLNQLDDLIEYYLKHGAERARIKTDGHLHTLENHTFNNRIEQMLNIIGEKNDNI